MDFYALTSARFQKECFKPRPKEEEPTKKAGIKQHIKSIFYSLDNFSSSIIFTGKVLCHNRIHHFLTGTSSTNAAINNQTKCSVGHKITPPAPL